jgi:hypothetical protein
LLTDQELFAIEDVIADDSFEAEGGGGAELARMIALSERMTADGRTGRLRAAAAQVHHPVDIKRTRFATPDRDAPGL